MDYSYDIKWFIKLWYLFYEQWKYDIDELRTMIMSIILNDYVFCGIWLSTEWVWVKETIPNGPYLNPIVS